MQIRWSSWKMRLALLAATALSGSAVADEPRLLHGSIEQTGHRHHKRSECCDPCITAAPAQPAAPSDAAAPPAPEMSSDFGSAFETASATDTLAPNMLGDSGYPYSSFSSSFSSSSSVPRERALMRYKLADNGSPMPQGRVYYMYNYFHDVFGSTVDVHRNLGGAEIPLFDNNFSVEVRNGVNTFAGAGPNQTEGNNLVTTFKALGLRTNNAVLSGGAAVGWPTGPVPDGAPGGNALIAPFAGYIFTPGNGDLFIQGFQQIDIPTASEDQMVMHTDIGAGLWLRRGDEGRLITGIAPTFELHLYTPIGDAPSGSLTGLAYNDILTGTLGTTLIIGDRASLALGINFPLSTTKEYDYEAQVQFNWLFRR